MRFVVNIFAILLILAVSVHASKLGEGRKLVGGTASFTSQSGKLYEDANGDGNTIVSINPIGGVFVGPAGLVVGGYFMYSSDSQSETSSWSLGPVVQYYIGAAEDKDMYPYLEAAFVYGSYDNDGNEASSTTIHLGGGLLFLLNDYVGINGLLVYNIDSYEPDGVDAIDGSQFGIEAGFTIFLD